MKVYLVIEEEYEAGHFVHAVCSTFEKAKRIKDWYQRNAYVCVKTIDVHPILREEVK